MATTLEYGLIVAGIAAAATALTYSLSSPPTLDDLYKREAAKACVARPAGDKSNVVIEHKIGRLKAEYQCSNWPKILNPSFVRFR